MSLLERTYAVLMRAYPRGFRDEYGTDMQLLLRDQLRDEAAARVWARALIDLFINVPARHLEAHMSNRNQSVIPALFAGLSIAGVVGAIVAGSEWRVAAVTFAVAVAAAIAAAIAWRQTHSIAAGGASDQWWKFLIAGVGVIIAFAVVTSIIGDLGGETQWIVAMVALAIGVTLTATGLVLALVSVSRKRASA